MAENASSRLGSAAKLSDDPPQPPAELSLLADEKQPLWRPEAAWHQLNDMHLSSVIAHHRFLAHGQHSLRSTGWLASTEVQRRCCTVLRQLRPAADAHFRTSTVDVIVQSISQPCFVFSFLFLFFFFATAVYGGLPSTPSVPIPSFGRSQQCGIEGIKISFLLGRCPAALPTGPSTAAKHP